MGISMMDALRKVVTDVSDWTSDKLNGKVDKVGGKQLTDQNYSLTDKTKVDNMATGLAVLDGKLYLKNNEGLIEASATTLPSGSGGGGTSASITLLNLLESNEITVAVGSEANLVFEYSSSETDNSGTAYVYVGGTLKKTYSITPGENTLNIGELIGEGINEVKLTCSDIYSNSKSLSYVVNAISLRLTSTFDDSQIYDGDVTVKYTPIGAVKKDVHFVLDGVDTIVATTSETGNSQTHVISGDTLAHGVHDLGIYLSAEVGGVPITSDRLQYSIIAVDQGATTPIISSVCLTNTLVQGEQLQVNYIVYDPVNMNADVTLTVSQNEEVYSQVVRTVNSTKQTWNTRDLPSGEVTLTITYGVINRIHTITVLESDIDLSIKTTDLDFNLMAAGKSNEDSDRDVWEDNGVSTSFEYVNWESTGWVSDANLDTALRLSGDAKATINFKPFLSDARQTGRTIEMEFAIRDVNNREAVAISCLSGGIGFTVTADTAKITSEQTEISCNYTDEEKVYVTFVIESRTEYRMMSVYLNGVLSGAKQYPETDNMQQNPTVDITVGSPHCSVDLYSMRSYNTALTTNEVRDNYIASVTNVNEQLALYEENNIYDVYGNLSFAALKNKIPVLVITGSLPTYKGDKRNVSVSYTDPFNPSLNFEDTAKIDVQGTSSAGYVRKNWKIKTNEPHILDVDQVETNVLCWKVDYAEATGTHNTGNANYVDLFYEDVKTPPEADDDRIRTTIYGRPCVIFHKATSASEPVFYGKSNANVDKGGEEVFGFTHPEYSVIAQSVEFCNNDVLACKFHAPIPEDWGDAFEFRYPDGHDDISAFKIVHDWVVSTWQEGATGDALPESYTGVDGSIHTHDTAEYRLAKFKKEFTEHFELDFCLIYYLYTFVILMVDQRAKNMFLTTWDQVHWQPWLYDNDTCLGINNVGQLVFDYYHEDHDYLGDKYVYNGAESALWVNFREAFADEIKELYTEWRKHEGSADTLLSYEGVDSLLSYNKIIEYFITRQSDKWSISVYNEDAKFKYVSMLHSDNNATYLFQIRGTGEEHLKYFAKNRLMYCDSKWNAGYYPQDMITLRLYSPEGDLAIAPNHDITVTPYSNIYAGVKYNANGTLQQKRAEKNVPITFNASTDSEFGDTDSYIYGASEMSSIGDLASLYCGYVDVSKATKLTELIIGSGVEGYVNTNLVSVLVGTNKLLKKIDIRNCPNVTDPLALANCPNIEEIYATGSGITGVELPSSGYLKKVYLPDSLTNLTVTNQQYIEEFTLEGYNNLTTLRVENTVNVPIEDIINNATKLNRIRLIDAVWTAESEEALATTIERFKTCLGLGPNGENIDSAVVTGRVYVPSISDELYNDIYRNFPNLIVDDGNVKYIVDYRDWDGQTLHTVRVEEGSNAYDPIEEGIIEAPFRASDENYSYEFIGWSTLPTNINRHHIITAQYKTKVAVNFCVDGTIMYTEYAIYGECCIDPIEAGLMDIPVKEGTDDLRYMFSGWDGSLLNITMPRTVNALFSNVHPIRFYATPDSPAPHYVQWVVEGQDAHDPSLDEDYTTPPDIMISADEKQVFSAWGELPTNVTGICAVHADYDTYWAVRFYNESIEVDLQWIKEGSSAVNPITRFENPIEEPTKASTAQYDFDFASWDGTYTDVMEPVKVYAVYSYTTRKYTVYFYNMEQLLYTVENVPYGNNATYSGATPTKLGVEDATKYDFTGWYPTGKNIQGETKCYALFRYNAYTEDSWETIAANIENGTAFDLYPVGTRKEVPVAFADGTEYIVDMEVIAHNHDDLADDSGKAALTFFCKDLPDFKHKMYENHTNSDGWPGSDMRTFTNGELFEALPEELRNVIKPVYKISDGGTNSKALVTTVDSCWIPSYDEVGFAMNRTDNVAGQGVWYSDTFGYGTDGNSTRIKYLSDGYTIGRWWLRTSSYGDGSILFLRVQNSGGVQSDGLWNEYYVAFGFCVGRGMSNEEINASQMAVLGTGALGSLMLGRGDQ